MLILFYFALLPGPSVLRSKLMLTQLLHEAVVFLPPSDQKVQERNLQIQLQCRELLSTAC